MKMVQSLIRAEQILKLLAERQTALSLSQIAQGVGLPKTTAHGIITTLRALRLVEQSAYTGQYRLGIRLFELGSAVARKWDLRTTSARYLTQLVEEFKETAQLAVLDQDQVLYIDKREGVQPFRIASDVGMRLPVHCTALGKVLLAYQPESEIRRIIVQRGLQRFTRATICQPELLFAELKRIRDQGYAIDKGEIMDFLRCVAAPIRNGQTQVIAAISISGPISRMIGRRFNDIRDKVVRAAAEISKEMGYTVGGAIKEIL